MRSAPCASAPSHPLHAMPPRITRNSDRPRASDRTMVDTISPACRVFQTRRHCHHQQDPRRMDNRPNLQRNETRVGWISRKESRSGRGGAFFLTSLFIELIDWLLLSRLCSSCHCRAGVITPISARRGSDDERWGRKDQSDFAGNASFLALATQLVLGLHCDFRCGGTSAHGCTCTPTAICTTAIGRTRCDICVTCSSHGGAHSSGIGFCRAGSVCLHSPVRRCGVARTLSVSTRGGSGCYGLSDEQLFRWRQGGTLRGSVLQQSFLIRAISGMAPASRTGTDLTMDDTGNCSPSRHRNYTPGDGNILRDR